MTAKIIKLDEYLAELISMKKPDILKSIIEDMNVEEDIALALYNEMSREQEEQMVTAHLNDSLNDEQKLAVTHVILDPIMATKFNQPFGGVDISEGFNFRREVTNEVARNNIMDWLEENQIEYLIDNSGNFAVRCADRRTQYRVNRQFEHVLNKWDVGPVRKAVDPDVRRKALSPIVQLPNPLRDNLNEKYISEAAQDGSMPLPDLSGTPPMFPATEDGDMTDGLPAVYENTEDGAIKVLGDLINPSSAPYIEKLDEETNEWLVCDDAMERSFYVDTAVGQFEEVEYICEASGPTYGHGHSGRRAGVMPGPDDPRGDKHDLPVAYDEYGRMYASDPIKKKLYERFREMFRNVGLEDLIDADKAQKLDLMLDYNVYSVRELADDKGMAGALKAFNNIVGDIYNRVTSEKPTIAEAKKSNAKKREKEAKEKLANKRTGEGGAAAGAMINKQKAGAHDPDKYSRKEKHKKDVQLDEGMLGAATGMTAMQTLGLNRLRQLAGLPDSSMTVVEEVPVETEEKREPIVCSGEELVDINDALEHLGEVFNIYKSLDTADKKELRYTLINTIMEDGIRLSESVIDLLLADKPSILLEFEGEEKILSDDDKAYLKEVIAGIKDSIVEDIDIMNEAVRVGLARIAYLLEMLQEQVEE